MPKRPIDWADIHRRLAVSASVISGGGAPGPEETRRILEARARKIARAPTASDPCEHLEILVFALSGETYGVETRLVREVCQFEDLTPIPCTPPWVAGVMNRRGRLLTVVDLRRFFELPGKGLTELNRVVAIQDGEAELGLLADSITGVRTIAVTDLQDGLPTLTGTRERFFRGVTGELVAVLDGARLLMDPSIKVHETEIR